MKLHNLFGAICVLGGTLALSSCEKYDELFPAQYHCVLNIKDAGIRNTELYTTEAEGTIPISIMKTGSKGEAPANGTLVPMTEEAFQAYCTNNALKYAYLPAAYYTMPNEELQFSAQERYKIMNVVLKTREILKLQESNHGQKYALPLLLHGNGASVHDSLLIIAPDIKAPSLELTSAGFVSAVQFTSKGEAKQTHTVELALPTPNAWGLKCSVTCNEEAVEAFKKYNAQNGNRYQQLPANAYTLPNNGVVTFAEAATTATMEVTFNRTALQWENIFFLLPFPIPAWKAWKSKRLKKPFCWVFLTLQTNWC